MTSLGGYIIAAIGTFIMLMASGTQANTLEFIGLVLMITGFGSSLIETLFTFQKPS